MASVLNPPTEANGYTPLGTLAERALRDFGNHAANRATGDVMLAMLDWANEIIDELRLHPYGQGTLANLPYYTSLTETRPIPDQVVKAGLLAKYALQQGSERAMVLMTLYHQAMNRALYWLAHGGNPRHQLQTFDKDPHTGKHGR